MNLTANWSISTKITGIIVAVTALALTLGFSLLLYVGVSSHRQQHQEALVTQARLVGDYAVSPLLFDDAAGALDVLEKLSQIRSVTHAVIYKLNGEAFASYTRDTSQQLPSADPAMHETGYLGDSLWVKEPIVFENRPYGTLLVRAVTRELDEWLQRVLVTLGAFLLVLIGFAYALAQRLQLLVTRPILELAETMRLVSDQQNYSLRSRKWGNDEVGVLCDGFNAMMKLIDSTEIEREQRYRRVVESLAEGVVIQTPDQGIIATNRSAARLLGITQDTLLGGRLNDARWKPSRRDGSALPAGEHPIQLTLDDGSPRRDVLLGLTGSDGAHRWISVNTQPLSKPGDEAPYAAVASFQDVTALIDSLETLSRKNQLLGALGKVQAEFIVRHDEKDAFELMLDQVLKLTDSEYGLIAGVLTEDNGTPYLKVRAISEITWNAETRALYEEQGSQEMEFHDLDNLLGLVITRSQPVLANDLANDPRSGELPAGHPELKNFLGLPLYLGDRLTGMIGLANREGGYDPEVIDELSPILHAGGNLMGAFDERRKRLRAQAALKDSESRLRAIMDNVVDSIITIDEQGTIQSFNKGAESMFGYGGSEVIGQAIHRLVIESFHNLDGGHSDPDGSTDGSKDRSAPREVTGRHRDGRTFPIEITTGAVEIQGKRLITGILRDISERKRLEAELDRHRGNLDILVQERTRELEAANEEIKQFAYIVSHDLRAPLVNIVGFARELRQGLEEVGYKVTPLLSKLTTPDQDALVQLIQEELPEAMDFIDSSSLKMDRQISAILKLSRAGRQELKFGAVDIGALVQETVDSLNQQLEAHKASVRIDELPTVYTDRTSIEQILNNILDNAVKYLDPERPGSIHVSAEDNDAETLIHVKDNGVGIDAVNIDKIFLLFRRATPSAVAGEGMGLAHVKALVRQLNGRIWCESEPGKGSIFSFSIPKKIAGKSGYDHSISDLKQATEHDEA